MSETASLEVSSPSEAVVERVANAENVDPLELPPLYDSIEPDALNALTAPSGREDSGLEISFTYHGYEVRVTGEGVVHLDEPQRPLLASE